MATSLVTQRVVPVNPTVSHILFKATGEVTQASVEKQISAMFGNKVRCLSGSAYYPSESDTLVAAFVEVNTEKRPYSEEAMGGFKTVAANMFVDENDNIWRSMGAGEDRILVRDSDDDLDAILSSRRGVSIDTASTGVFLGESFDAGDCVAYYDTASEEWRPGLAVSSTHVFNLETQSLDAVEASTAVLVIEADVTNVNTEEVAMEEYEPNDATNALKKHLSYMKTLFNQNGEYFKKLESLIQQNYGSNMGIV